MEDYKTSNGEWYDAGTWTIEGYEISVQMEDLNRYALEVSVTTLE